MIKQASAARLLWQFYYFSSLTQHLITEQKSPSPNQSSSTMDPAGQPASPINCGQAPSPYVTVLTPYHNEKGKKNTPLQSRYVKMLLQENDNIPNIPNIFISIFIRFFFTKFIFFFIIFTSRFNAAKNAVIN